MREDYIRRYTGTTRYDTRNYDLVINMDGMTASSHIRPAEGETDTGAGENGEVWQTREENGAGQHWCQLQHVYPGSSFYRHRRKMSGNRTVY